MEEVKCVYRDSCKDYPKGCEACTHNKGKKSHYAPSIEPFLVIRIGILVIHIDIPLIRRIVIMPFEE